MKTLIALGLLLMGCGTMPIESVDADAGTPEADARRITLGADARSDTGTDAGRAPDVAVTEDTGSDAGFGRDTGSEVVSDSDRDTGSDTGPDAGTDTGSSVSDPHALRIVLTWTAIRPGDLDLHVHNGDTSRPWYSPADCYYSNRAPSWGAVFEGPDSYMFGPEVTRIDHPVPGETYTVGVQALSFDSVGGRATVEIYCGGTLVSTTYATVNVSSGNECETSRMFRMASIVGGGCEATPIGTSTTGASACMTF